MSFMFHDTDDDEPRKPLTPEEDKTREQIDLIFGGVMLVVAILVFGIVLWAFIVSS
jgi:hypothetical protein